MFNWSFFKKKKKIDDGLKFFQVSFQDDNIFGVTATNATEAEAIVCEEVFHNQTIPGFPEVSTLTEHQVKKFKGVSINKAKLKGIWFPKK